jgi:DNA-binding transcriptional ArsR family regulator
MTYVKILNALGDSTRRQVFEMLRARPSSVGELARRLPVSQPAVSQHLRVLREAGLVDVRPDGRRRVYRPRPAGLGPLRAYIEGMWADALEAYGEEAVRRAGAASPAGAST